MHNGKETWHILKSSYVEKTPIHLTDQFFGCHQKLRMFRKCPRFPYSRAFFNYITVNDNKTTNNYLRLSDFQHDMSIIFYNSHCFLPMSTNI